MAKLSEQKPSRKVQHRKRTEDELRKALAMLESKPGCLNVHSDDEHDVVLADAVCELLATRQVVVKLMQQLDSLNQEALVAIKNMVIE